MSSKHCKEESPEETTHNLLLQKKSKLSLTAAPLYLHLYYGGNVWVNTCSYS